MMERLKWKLLLYCRVYIGGIVGNKEIDYTGIMQGLYPWTSKMKEYILAPVDESHEVKKNVQRPTEQYANSLCPKP